MDELFRAPEAEDVFLGILADLGAAAHAAVAAAAVVTHDGVQRHGGALVLLPLETLLLPHHRTGVDAVAAGQTALVGRGQTVPGEAVVGLHPP